MVKRMLESGAPLSSAENQYRFLYAENNSL